MRSHQWRAMGRFTGSRAEWNGAERPISGRTSSSREAIGPAPYRPGSFCHMVDLSSSFRLDGQAAVVTGGASGIGEATAQVLAAAGAAVVIGEADGGRAVALRADTTKRADVDALVDRAVADFGQLDIMCNVAGVGYGKPVV